MKRNADRSVSHNPPTDPMIKKLRRRFTAGATAISFAVLLITLCTVIGIIGAKQLQEADSKLLFISETGGDFTKAQPNGDKPDLPDGDEPLQSDGNDSDGAHAPDRDSHLGFEVDAETKYRTRYFSVSFTGDDTEKNASYSMDHIAAVTPDEALDMANTAIASGKTKGFSDHYRFLVSVEGDTTQVVFLDCAESFFALSRIMKISLTVFAAVMLAIFAGSLIFSKAATRTFETSLRKQKRFITDASHEIKTPLAIIAANTEVLRLCCEGRENEGECAKWLDSIQRQTIRMSSLLASLIELAKFDEGSQALSVSDFSMSAAVLDTAAEFEAPAAAKGLVIEAAVEPDVNVCADEAAVRRVVSALCDNAVKYGVGTRPVTICLKKKGTGAELSVTNGAEGVSEKQLGHLFDRFYRADSSRARESGHGGGYGIGLAMVYSVAVAHGGSVEADANRKDGSVTITFRLP